MDKDAPKWKKEDIAVKDLSLWDENARFPEEYFNKTERSWLSIF